MSFDIVKARRMAANGELYWQKYLGNYYDSKGRHKEAIKWRKKAAALGDPKAQQKVREYYERKRQPQREEPRDVISQIGHLIDQIRRLF